MKYLGVLLASVFLAFPVQAQTRTREVLRMPVGGSTVTIRAESTGYVYVAVSRGVFYASFMEFSPSFGQLLPRADSSLVLSPSVKAAPGEVIEYDSPFVSDRYGSRLRLSLRVRTAGSMYLLYVSDDTGVNATVTAMTPTQYQQFRAALSKAIKLAYDMMG